MQSISCPSLLAGQEVSASSIHLTNTATVELEPLVAGLLIVQAVLTVNDTQYHSQGSVTVQPGPASLNRTRSLGPGLVGAVAGKPAQSFVQLLDGFGNAAVSCCCGAKCSKRFVALHCARLSLTFGTHPDSVIG